MIVPLFYRRDRDDRQIWHHVVCTAQKIIPASKKRTLRVGLTILQPEARASQEPSQYTVGHLTSSPVSQPFVALLAHVGGRFM